tara:strand:+ start:4328 stop:4462 length:135 start_codon:yes stop_codon:yes gene_type:complete
MKAVRCQKLKGLGYLAQIEIKAVFTCAMKMIKNRGAAKIRLVIG